MALTRREDHPVSQRLIFQLIQEKLQILKSQIVTSSWVSAELSIPSPLAGEG
jgi:hypothetical protein